TTAQTVSALGARLHQKGSVDKTCVPAPLAARCAAMDEVLTRINAGAQRLFEEALRGDKTTVVAGDFAAMGRMMSDTLEAGRTEFTHHEALGERIAAHLQRRGYTLESACVCGTARRQVLLRGLRLPGRHIKVRELRGILEGASKLALGEVRVTQTEDGRDYLFSARPKYAVRTVKQSRAKAGREGGYCGDSVTSLHDAKGNGIALLCDGMGSGNAAALCSALSATVLSRLLRAGNRVDTSLRMLNGVLAARGQRENEASTTVDLLEIDGVCGTGTFYKCGAAPSYLLRAGQITRFFSRTAPVGILETLDAERISFEVQSGDVIVQVSDGVTGGEEECLWLAELLQSRWDGEAEKFARLILNRASESGGDDLSVMITEVFDAPEPGGEAAG
ncbi:MAG: SpoIIE family protein phosphatase, partial [Clostridia bacterium]|nr:SpoIIE family protein phosphatase [Clostridia bacterium]